MLEITNNFNKLVVVLLSCVLFLTTLTVFAKDQTGDPFGASYGPAFPQREFALYLNSLQVSANPLFGEPFSIADIESELKLPYSNISHGENFLKLLNVFPNYRQNENNIFKLDALALKTGRARSEVWSYNSLPVFKGGIASRYQSTVFQNSEDWSVLHQHYRSNLPQDLVAQGQVNLLSPIEKYEQLIGNTEFSLTESEWKKGQNYFNTYRHVPKWIGYCNGTAPAVFKHQRPSKAIKLMAYDGNSEITFYPSDIKQLLSYSWGTTENASAIVGRRCGQAVYDNIRPSSQCLDVNPATFFLATLNLQGIHKQAFIIDTYAGSEVWNSSIVSYRYGYFLPGSRLTTDNLSQAMRNQSDYPNDPFRDYRSVETNSIVDVWMEITIIAANKASTALTDSASNDIYRKINYRFDLEIDKSGKIIGGEWASNVHPDFIWVVSDNHFPSTMYDSAAANLLVNYSGINPLQYQVLNYAQRAANEGKVLQSLLHAMLRLSQ